MVTMSTEKFCLRWNDFENNISEAFRELRDDKDFFDVTIACEDEQLQAHKVILSACSPFFRNVLRRNPHQHPLLYLKGVKYTDLQSVLNFMYHGEVNVAQEELNSFLAVAEELRVKGLTQNTHSRQEKTESVVTETAISHYKPPVVTDHTPPIHHQPILKPPPPPLPVVCRQQHHPVAIQPVPVKCEPPPIIEPIPVATNSLQTTLETEREDYYEEQEDYIQYGGEQTNFQVSQMDIVETENDNDYNKGHKQKLLECLTKVEENGIVVYKCVLCGKTSQRRDALSNHVENIHFPGSYQCHFCEQVFNSQNTRNVHIGRKHKFS